MDFASYLARSIFAPFVLVFLSVLLGACSTWPQMPLTLEVQATADLNPNARLQALPVLLKIYQLKSSVSFTAATFQQLWKHDREVLASSLLSYREITITPGMQQKINLNREAGAEYIGIVATFRQPHLGNWRSLKKLPPPASSFFSRIPIHLDAHTVRIGT